MTYILEKSVSEVPDPIPQCLQTLQAPDFLLELGLPQDLRTGHSLLGICSPGPPLTGSFLVSAQSLLRELCLRLRLLSCHPAVFFV